MKRQTAALTLAIWAISSVALAQAPDQPFPEEARKRLDYGIGDWTSRTESLDRKGKVIRTSHSDTQRRFVIEDRVIEISGVSRESGQMFRAWEYYDVASGKYCITSVSRDGRLTTMKGDLGEVFRWATDGQVRPDGSTRAMRFTHSEIKANSFTALGELSMDGGKTWRPFTRQFLTRQSAPTGSQAPAAPKPTPR